MQTPNAQFSKDRSDAQNRERDLFGETGRMVRLLQYDIGHEEIRIEYGNVVAYALYSLMSNDFTQSTCILTHGETDLWSHVRIANYASRRMYK